MNLYKNFCFFFLHKNIENLNIMLYIRIKLFITRDSIYLFRY